MSSGLPGWLHTWQELGAPAADESLYERLMVCWAEPHRRYHTLHHLRECLTTFDEVRDQAQRPGEIDLALWFHDAFYDPRRHDNEERSAQWAREAVQEAGLPQDVADRVYALVMATRHEAPPEDPDARLLVDVDLASLGAEARRFDEDDLQIRAEYAHVPEIEYREGRRRVLGSFLARPRLYSTDYFHSALEERARNNLRRAIARLEA
jgi:predicted metal-dependent HD superfamily phosphohydrolase